MDNSLLGNIALRSNTATTLGCFNRFFRPTDWGAKMVVYQYPLRD